MPARAVCDIESHRGCERTICGTTRRIVAAAACGCSCRVMVGVMLAWEPRRSHWRMRRVVAGADMVVMAVAMAMAMSVVSGCRCGGAGST